MAKDIETIRAALEATIHAGMTLHDEHPCVLALDALSRLESSLAAALHPPAPVTDAMMEREREAIERICQFALDNSFSTGHADTITDALDEILPQVDRALTCPAQAQVDVEKYGIAIRNAIFDSLQNYYLQHTASDDNEGYSLIDALTPPGGTVDKGQDESFLLADHISVAVCDRLTPKTQEAEG